MLTVVLRESGHRAGGPKGVDAQSKAFVSDAISPEQERKIDESSIMLLIGHSDCQGGVGEESAHSRVCILLHRAPTHRDRDPSHTAMCTLSLKS